MLQAELPELVAHMAQLGVSDRSRELATRWFSAHFSASLPPDLAARVLDAGLSWRAKTATAVPRLALGFWKVHAARLLTASEPASFDAAVAELTRPEAMAADAARWLQAAAAPELLDDSRWAEARQVELAALARRRARMERARRLVGTLANPSSDLVSPSPVEAACGLVGGRGAGLRPAVLETALGGSALGPVGELAAQLESSGDAGSARFAGLLRVAAADADEQLEREVGDLGANCSVGGQRTGRKLRWLWAQFGAGPPGAGPGDGQRPIARPDALRLLTALRDADVALEPAAAGLTETAAVAADADAIFRRAGAEEDGAMLQFEEFEAAVDGGPIGAAWHGLAATLLLEAAELDVLDLEQPGSEQPGTEQKQEHDLARPDQDQDQEQEWLGQEEPAAEPDRAVLAAVPVTTMVPRKHESAREQLSEQASEQGWKTATSDELDLGLGSTAALPVSALPSAAVAAASAARGESETALTSEEPDLGLGGSLPAVGREFLSDTEDGAGVGFARHSQEHHPSEPLSGAGAEQEAWQEGQRTLTDFEQLGSAALLPTFDQLDQLDGGIERFSEQGWGEAAPSERSLESVALTDQVVVVVSVEAGGTTVAAGELFPHQLYDLHLQTPTEDRLVSRRFAEFAELHREASLLLREAAEHEAAQGLEHLEASAAEFAAAASRLALAFPPKHMLKTATGVVAYRCGRLLDYLHGHPIPPPPNETAAILCSNSPAVTLCHRVRGAATCCYS